MKLPQRYTILALPLSVITLYLAYVLMTLDTLSLGIHHFSDPTVRSTQYEGAPVTVDQTQLNRLLDYYTRQNVSCYDSPVRIDPFVEGPAGFPTLGPEQEAGTCSRVHFSPVGVARTALASYQGSGNTWLRHLIHELTGLHTGSVYTDDAVLLASGFLGEGWTNRSVVAVKTHGAYSGNITDVYDRGILLIRNPYHALVSEFNRRKGHGHTALADKALFASDKWSRFIQRGIRDWHAVTKAWLRYPRFCLHIVHYTDLLTNLYEELVRLAVFLGVDPDHVTARHINCVLNNAQGQFRRRRRQTDLSVFTAAMNATIQGFVKDVEFVAMNKKKVKLKVFR